MMKGATETVTTTTCVQVQTIFKNYDIALTMGHQTGHVKKKNSVAVTHKVWGLTIDMLLKRLIARTDDTNGPLKVYSYDGQLVETLGAGIKGLAANGWRGICMDTSRDCYLAVCDSSLVVVNRAGQQTKSISVGSSYNRGVAYGRGDDIYVVSDTGKNTVYLVNPATAQVTRQFGSNGSGLQFRSPYSIHVGRVAGIDRLCIIVGDWYNDNIILFDTFGNHVKTYGSPGSGEGYLQYPRGVITDAAGRVVVCDEKNKRVLSYWTDKVGQDRSECLLHNDWDNKQPRLLTLDTDNNVMASTDGTLKILHIYNLV